MSLPKFLLESRICNKDTCEIKRKLDQYEDPEDLTLFYMWLDEKAKDKMKQLQDRIKELETINEEHRELNGTLRKENQILRENAEHNDKVVDKARWDEMIYKTRNEKAIEYINHITDELTVDFWNDKTDGAFEDLLEILQGSDNSE